VGRAVPPRSLLCLRFYIRGDIYIELTLPEIEPVFTLTCLVHKTVRQDEAFS